MIVSLTKDTVCIRQLLVVKQYVRLNIYVDATAITSKYRLKNSDTISSQTYNKLENAN